MKNNLVITCLILLVVSCGSFRTESIYKGESQNGKHARGLEVFGDNVLVSGYEGAYSRFDLTTKTWLLKDSIKGIEDFRDVHIINDSTFIFLNSGVNGDIWRVEGGEKRLVYHHDNMFLDGLDFDSTGQFGYAYGDPINGQFVFLKTVDYGKSWYKILNVPLATNGEAGFAASGTGITCFSENVVMFVTGSGSNARVFKTKDGCKTWEVVDTPIKSGGSYGIYTSSFIDENVGIVAGGSYKDSTYRRAICFSTDDGGNNWVNISEGLPGYVSCVSVNPNFSLIVATGRNGVYYSIDKGERWHVLTQTPYYSCKVTSQYIVLSGKNGIFEVFTYAF